MKKKSFNIVNFEGFVSQFMQNEPQSFNYKLAPFQIYPLSVALSFIKPPTSLFRTDHNFLLLFAKGGGEQQVDNDIQQLNANDVLFIREGHLNAIKSIDENTNGYYIYVDNLLISQIFTDKALLNRFTFNPKHSVEQGEMEWLCQCCDLIMKHKNNFNNSIEVEASLLKAIITKLAKTWPSGLSKSDRQSEITMLFKELLYDNFMHTRNVKFYADSLAVSENYLNRCVNNVTNKAPKQHINEVIIYHSRVLLQDFSKNIAQVALELNFQDASYFGRLFKQLTAQTPLQYRNSLSQDLS